MAYDTIKVSGDIISSSDWNNFVIALENTSTGHDHDGTDSKVVDCQYVTFTPAGTITSTNVQDALEELSGEIVAEDLWNRATTTVSLKNSGDTLSLSGPIILSEAVASITHSGATSLTILSTIGTVIIEGLTFTGTAVTGASSITSTSFVGALTGNANTSSNRSGLSATATALATSRTINGVGFDGTSNITVTADANTLSGTTLKSTVINSSLTSVGTLLDLTGTAFSVNEGTLTDTKYCTYEAGTGIQCTSEGGGSSFTSIATLNALLTGETVASTTASNANFVNDAGYTTNTGDVTKVGTPVDNQIAVWTDATTIEGTSGLTYSGSALGITGSIASTGNITASTNGSSQASPRVFGYTDLSAGEAARFEFGDEHNALANAYGNDINLYSYWGLVLSGGRQNYNSGFNPMPFSKTLDTGVLVKSDTIGLGNDPSSSGNPITTLGVMATSTQWANLTEWMDSDGATMSLVDSTGNFVIGDTATTTKALSVNGDMFLSGSIGIGTTTPTDTLHKIGRASCRERV